MQQVTGKPSEANKSHNEKYRERKRTHRERRKLTMESIEEGEAEKVNAEEHEQEEGVLDDTKLQSGRNAQEELANLASQLMAAAAAAQAEDDGGGLEGEENSSSGNNEALNTLRMMKPLVKKARKLLFRRLRVGVEDNRVFIGKFHCLDKQGNIILYDTVEYRQIPPPSRNTTSGDEAATTEQRSLGLVLIPARCRTSCYVECSLDEQFSLLSV